MNSLKIIVNWIKESYSDYVIAKHLARVALYELEGEEALYPEVKKKCDKLVEIMEEKGKPIKVVPRTGTFRSVPDQRKLSSSVTNAGGLQSYHQYGLAFDVMFENYQWSPPSQDWWYELGEAGEDLDLIWGGRWQARDMGHFEWHGVDEEFTWKELKKYFEK